MRFVGGNDGRVFAVNPGVRELGVFEWGTKPASAKCIALAKCLLREVLDDEARVTRFYMRFMHRTVGQWRQGQPWTQTDAELLAVVSDIEQTEKDTAQLRDKMARQLPDMIARVGPEFPGSQGYGGNDSAPDRRRK